MKEYNGFAVGDRIVIREWDDMFEEFGDPSEDFDEYAFIDTYPAFVYSMKKFCGRHATIKGFREVIDYKLVILDFDDNSGNPNEWNYCTDMLEHEVCDEPHNYNLCGELALNLTLMEDYGDV